MAGYRAHIEWIALNDDTEIGDEETGYIISIAMTADVFGKEQSAVAKSVLNYRERNGV